MDNPLVQQLSLSTFTPSTMSREMLEGMFVQREQLLHTIVQDLAASVDGTKKYLMLVGARGMGKTHFVSLAYHRLKQRSDLENRLLIAWLREEEYGVNSWLYLIIEILRSLSQEGIDTEEQITKLANLTIPEAEYIANRVLTELIGNKTLLIIAENLDKLLFGLGEKEQWKFRSFLQETNCCSILATTPKISQDTSSKNKPFFGLFTPIHLPAFEHTDAVEMLIKIANLSGNTNLAKFLNTNEGKSRVRALHHLAGGNPRVYALFAQLITEETLEVLLPAVSDMLDKLTPYYQSRVESLGQSDDQQKIVMYLARETRAVTVKEITAQCFISSERTTSNALKKLKEKGYVISTQRGREVFYEISEVLMRLCLEMKNTRNGDLKLCVDFLRIWYRPQERQEYLERLEADGKLEQAKYFRLSLANAKIDALLEREIAEEFYLKGLSLSESEKWEEALEIFDRALQSKPDKYEAWFKRGYALHNLDRNEEAIESFNRAIQINSDYDDAWFMRGRALHFLGKDEEAIVSLDRAIQIKSDEHRYWTNRGYALNSLDRYEEAIESFNRATQICPNCPNAPLHKGLALYYLDRYEEAIDSFDRAIKLNAEDNTVWIALGFTLFKLGKYEEAIDSFDRAIKINAEDNNPWKWRGGGLYILDRYEEAIDSFDRAIKIEPDEGEAWVVRGFVLNELGRYEEAIESFDRAIKINAEDNDAWEERGVALRDLGRYEEAIDSFNRAIQIKPDDNILWKNRGFVLHNLGKYEEAIASFDRAIQIQPDKHETWHYKGLAFYKWGKYQESLNAYQQAINIKPDKYDSWHNKGLVLFHLGNYDEALTAWKEAFSIISNLKPSDTSDLIQEFLDEQLLPKFQQPAVRNLLPQLLTIYSNAQVLPELGVALTRNLKGIQSPTISDYTAIEWLKMWQELGKPHPELALALKMLEAGIKYKQNPTDNRVFLSLPQEMRPLLREALGLEE